MGTNDHELTILDNLCSGYINISYF